MESSRVRPPAAPMGELRPGDPTQVGPYRIEARIGEGGMGSVYLGRGPEGHPVAVKVVKPELAGDRAFLARFHDEARNAQRVASFCTAQVLQHGEDLGLAYLATEYIDGPSLLEHVNENGQLSPGMLHGVAVGVAAALVAIHSAGLVHRDLKPSNVLLSITGPRVIDFGIARALDEASSHTRTGQVVGTPGYIAPEQITTQEITPAVDIFAWGCLVAYAANARNPFGQGSFHIMMGRALHGDPDLGALTEPLAALVREALNKDPERRPTARGLLLTLVGGGASEADVNTTLGEAWTAPPLPVPSPGGDARVAASPAEAPPEPRNGPAGETITDPSAHARTPPPAPSSTPPPPMPAPPVALPQPGPPPQQAAQWSPPRADPAAGHQQGGASAQTPTYLPEQQQQQWTEPRASGPGTDPTSTLQPHPAAFPAPAPPQERPTAHRRTSSRRVGPLVTGAAAILAAAAAAGAYFLVAGGDDPGKARESAAPGAMPTDPMLVRIDTEAGWPSQCHADIGSYTPGAAAPTPLVGGGTCDTLPERSPDGSRIAFSRKNGDKTEAWVANADGRDPRKVTDRMAGGRVAWSPDSARLAFMAREGKIREIYTVAVDGGGEPQRLTSDGTDKDDPMWSKTGRIAFWSKRDGVEQIYTLDAGNPTQAWTRVTKDDERSVDPEWSPDGKQLAYTRGDGDASDIWLVGADGSNPRALVKGGGHDMDPSWSRDGTWLCYVRGATEKPQIRAIRVTDGKGDRAVTPQGRSLGHPNW